MAEKENEKLNSEKEVVDPKEEAEDDVELDSFSTLNVVGGTASWKCPNQAC
jgi:hypothetical protein